MKNGKEKTRKQDFNVFPIENMYTERLYNKQRSNNWINQAVDQTITFQVSSIDLQA